MGIESECLVFVDDAGMATWLNRLSGREGLTVDTIGSSRDGRKLYGFTAGTGDRVFTITAGAHADEPAGPLTAMKLLDELTSNKSPHRDLLSQYTFVVCPQVNPDGAQRNNSWFAETADLGDYLENVHRELPGDDVEFGYPGAGKGPLRPENQAVSQFFSSYAPASAHVSLHSMAFAEGAWFLLGGRAIGDFDLRDALSSAASAAGFGLHDIQRNGDKGFTRIAPGFCTTPDSRAMAQHFIDEGDEGMAAKFHYSSMEWALGRNPGAYVMVTEIPAFSLMKGYGEVPPSLPVRDTQAAAAPAPGETAYEKFRDSLKSATARKDMTAIHRLASEYHVNPVPFSAQCSLMLAAVNALAIAAKASA